MIKQLYKKFQNWSEGRSLFCFSDPHFSGKGSLHKGALLDSDEIKMRKLFNYAPDKVIIENINKVVDKNQCIIWLGDIGDPIVMEQIKCKNNILIKGNHDHGDSIYFPYFQEVFSGPLFISDKVVLSHQPMVKELKSLGLFNICGHIHNQSEIDNLHNEGYNNFLCISANLRDYKPINLGDLFNRKGEFKDFNGLSECQGIHRIQIDKSVERKRKKNLSEFSCQ